MFDPFQNQILQAAGKYGFTQQFKAIQICQEYRNLAPTLLPKGALEQTRPKSYTKQTLVIGVQNSMWAEQLMMQKHRILEAINHKFGPGTVKNIRIEMVEPAEQDHESAWQCKLLR